MKIVVAFVFFLLHTTRGSIIKREAGSIHESCQTPKNETGVCKSTADCPSLLLLLKMDTPDGHSLLSMSICGFEGKEALVCCPTSPVGTTPAPLKRASRPPPGISRPTDAFNNTCGGSILSAKRVANGIIANVGEFPWMAALGYTTSPRSSQISWLCGGSLVTDRHVVTAAHCVRTPPSYNYELKKVRLGDINLIDSEMDGASPVDFDIESKMSHLQHNDVTKEYDIAIIKLKGKANFSSLIHPICLSDDAQFLNPDNSEAYVAGWGKTAFTGSKPNNVLQWAQLDMKSEQWCKNKYRLFHVTIDRRIVCAYSTEGKDTCQGDSGGPLMINYNDKFYLIGVVSYGHKCAERNYPGVYTKVPYFMNFINHYIKGL